MGVTISLSSRFLVTQYAGARLFRKIYKENKRMKQVEIKKQKGEGVVMVVVYCTG